MFEIEPTWPNSGPSVGEKDECPSHTLCRIKSSSSVEPVPKLADPASKLAAANESAMMLAEADQRSDGVGLHHHLRYAGS